MSHETVRSGMSNDRSPGEGRAIRPMVPENLARVRIVLIEPREPGNIGSVARALTGMGLSQLWLVHPLCDWQRAPDARRFASNSRAVLDAAREVSTLDEALAGVHYVVGTTHRRRVRRIAQATAARDAAAYVARVSQAQHVAVLFGREDFGMSNEDLARCSMVASIPMATKNPSLNLSQAVQIWCYELFLASVTEVDPTPYALAEHRQVEAAQDRILKMLQAVDFRPANGDWTAISMPIARVMGRTALEKRDLEVLMKICHDVETYIQRNCRER